MVSILLILVSKGIVSKVFSDENNLFHIQTAISLAAMSYQTYPLYFSGNTKFTRPYVYTYGSPRVGHPVFASRYNHVVTNSIRIFNIHDIIPTLPSRAYPPPFTKNGLYYRHVASRYPIDFQLNSLAVHNHEIVCYFKFLSRENPRYTEGLCAENEGFCPDTEMCVPFLRGCRFSPS